MTSSPDDQVLHLRAIKSERCAASDRNTCARSSESAPGDDPVTIEPPPLTNLVDGCLFGEPAFEPSWEHIQDHSGWFELTYVLSDDGSGSIVLIPDTEGIHADLLKLCRSYMAEG